MCLFCSLDYFGIFLFYQIKVPPLEKDILVIAMQRYKKGPDSIKYSAKWALKRRVPANYLKVQIYAKRRHSEHHPKSKGLCVSCHSTRQRLQIYCCLVLICDNNPGEETGDMQRRSSPRVFIPLRCLSTLSPWQQGLCSRPVFLLTDCSPGRGVHEKHTVVRYFLRRAAATTKESRSETSLCH